MKKMKLELRKETIEVLDSAQKSSIAGGVDVGGTLPTQGATTDTGGSEFAQSRVTCITVTKWDWDCGGSKTCQNILWV